MGGSRLRRFARENVSRGVAAVLAAALTVTSFSTPAFAVQDYSDLTTETQMVSEPETVKVSKYSATERDQLFNDNWKFQMGEQTGASELSYDDSDWETVQLPHDYSITQEFTKAGEAESGYLLGGIGWYRKSFILPAGAQSKRVNINFDGVYMDSTIYVNGKQVGYHPYGYSPFSVDITDALDPTGNNVLAVRVNHQLPSSRWYSGSGILRNVHLVLTDPLHIAHNGMKVEPNLDKSEVVIKTELTNEGDTAQSVTTTYTVFPREGSSEIGSLTTDAVSVAPGETKKIENTFDVSHPTAWSVDNPALYTVRAEVKNAETNAVLDTYEVTTGFRTLGYDANTGFSLNGEKLKLKGVSMHHDQGALGGVSAPAAIARQIDILKDMGVNAIRVTHNPASEDLVRLADEKGILLIEEMFDGWQYPKNQNRNDYARFFEQTVNAPTTQEGITEGMTWAEYDLKQTIRRDYNSPAIIQWSLGNEVSEGTSADIRAFFQQQANLIKWAQETDATRKVTRGDNEAKKDSATSSAAATLLDSLSRAGGVVGVNYMAGEGPKGYDGFHERHPNWLIEGSETASSVNSRGIYNRVSDGGMTGDKRLTSYDNSAVGWGKTASSAWYDVVTRDFVMGEFVWTGFDYIGEPTHWNGITVGAIGSWPSPKNSFFGIVDTAGFPKDSYYFYQSQWNEDVHTVHILPAWNENVIAKVNGNVPVVVYSDAKAVELFFTDEAGEKKSLGKKEFTTKTTDAGYTYQIYEGEGKSDVANKNLYLTWNVPWAPGALEAVGYDADGNVIQDAQGRSTVKTTGAPAKLVMTLDRETLEANYNDHAYAEISVVDAEGNEVPDAANEVTFTVSGAGYLAGTDNGEQADHTSYQSETRHAFSGKVLGIVGSTREAGAITITASAPGLESATATIQATPVSSEDPEAEVVDSYRYPKNYYVKVGNSPVLPPTVDVIYSDKSEGTTTVTWDQPTEEQIQQTGAFQISGKTALGDVVTANITMIEELGAILNYSTTTPVGQVPTLPQRQPGVLIDGKVLDITFDVQWTLPEPSVYDQAGTVTIPGTATVFGQNYDVTASVRVQQKQFSAGENVAPQAMTITQDIPTAKQSDTLNAIIDGELSVSPNVFGGPNQTIWSNYTNSNPTDGSEPDTTAEIVFGYATQQSFGEFVVNFVKDRNSLRYPDPETTEFWVSETSDGPWTQVPLKETIGREGANVKPYTYTPNAPVLATYVKLVVKNSSEVLQGVNPSTGIVEVELKSAIESSDVYNTAALESLTVNGEALSQATLDAFKFETEAQIANLSDLKSKDNAAVTELPTYEGVKRLILESEDHTLRNTFEIVLGTTPTLDPDDDSRDLDRAKTQIEVGNQQPNKDKDYALDGKFDTLWHTKWGSGLTGDLSLQKDGWAVLIADEPTMLDGLRYYGRNDSQPNGRILEYEVYASNTDAPKGPTMADGMVLPADDQYEKVAEGKWADEGGWKLATFDKPVLAKYVKLVPKHTAGDGAQQDIFVSAAELRLRKAVEKQSLNDPELGFTVTVTPEKVTVDQVDAEHPVTADQVKVEVKDKDGNVLTEGVNYTVSITNNTAAGTATVTIQGINTHEGTLTATFIIEVKQQTTDEPSSDDDTTEEPISTEEGPNEPDKPGKPVTPSHPGSHHGSGTHTGGNGNSDNPSDNPTPGTEPMIGEPFARYDGAARQDVAVRVARTFFPDAKQVILVQNLAFADALSANNIAQGEMPILYTAKDSIPQVTLDELRRVERDEVFLVGGPATISVDVEEQLKDEGFNVTRIGGKDRYALNATTASYVSNASTAVIASGMVYSDALSAAPYAYALNAPILLTATDRLPEGQEAVLEKMGNAVVAGGPKSVSSHVFNIVHGLVDGHIERLTGADRYEVAALIAERLDDVTSSAILASGEVWSDALVAGPVAQKIGAPILLTRQKAMPTPIQGALDALAPKQIILLGGLKSISAEVEALAKVYLVAPETSNTVSPKARSVDFEDAGLPDALDEPEVNVPQDEADDVETTTSQVKPEESDVNVPQDQAAEADVNAVDK
ncbi:MAG: cell wall-binding repeat-containing protein [Peptoniphilaceae bacterium]|nr:cell wall-binding repeat-containing protein [Peptoniphilaceae bacterium]